MIPIKGERFFSKVGLDFLGPIVSYKKDLLNPIKYVLVMTEYVSRMGWAFPTMDC